MLTSAPSSLEDRGPRMFWWVHLRMCRTARCSMQGRAPCPSPMPGRARFACPDFGGRTGIT